MQYPELTNDLAVESGVTPPEVPLTNSSDEEELLVRGAKNGDCSAFNRFVVKYQDSAFAAAYQIARNYEDAQDIVQIAFLKAWKAIRQFKEGAKFSTWLYSIVVNAGKDYCFRGKAKARRSRTVSLDAMNQQGSTRHEERPSSELMPDEQFQKGEALKMIRDGLDSLEISDRNRQIFTLRWYEAKKPSEIAQQFNLTRQRVEQIIDDVTKKLAPILREAYEVIEAIEARRARREQTPILETETE